MNRKSLLRKMCKNKYFILGGSGVLLILFLCAFSPWFVRFDATAADLSARLTPPQWLGAGISGHIFGTDPLGRDVLTRVLMGGRVSLFISFSVVILSSVSGIVLGLLAGYYGGAVDTVIMRCCDIMMATPSLLLAVCVVAVMGSSYTNLILVLTLTNWLTMSRVVRGVVLTIRNADYVNAARLLGASDVRIMAKEVFPNVLTQVIINATQNLGTVILIEASMSYLGMGVPLPTPAWGTMLSDGREYIGTAPWIVVVPGIALMLTVLSFNFLGDGIRDIFDPKNKD